MLSVRCLVLALTLLNVIVPSSCIGNESNKICYYKYGCFSDDFPFDRDFSTLPLPPILINTFFKLYTKASMHYDILQPGDNSTFVKSTFNSTVKTTLVIHGFNEYSSVHWVQQMTLELLNSEPMNVILVDWSGSSFTKLYPLAVGNSRLVGAQVEELIVWLCACAGVTTAGDFHLIGFSLGAQVAGYAGRRLRERGMLLRRITGLDPAGPGFGGTSSAVRLDPSDAEFVDVIHTDARPLIGFGIHEPIGHVDFYPNGASTQTGCHGYFGIFDSIIQGTVVNSLRCNHLRATELFIESIKSRCPMIAYPSRSWSDFLFGRFMACNGTCPVLGYHASNTSAHGSYYLHTTGEKPFCNKDFKVSVVIKSWWLHGTVLLSIQLLGKTGKSKLTTQKYIFRRNAVMMVQSAGEIGELESIKISYQGYVSLRLRSIKIRPIWSNEVLYTCCTDLVLTGYTAPQTATLKINQILESEDEL